MLDVLIRNGWLADGTGNPLRPADVAIEGDRIVEVGHLPGAQAKRAIDAAGKIVCPGFVDAHSHTDKSIRENPLAQSTIRQGTTTEVVGQCGGSMAPYAGRLPGAGASDPRAQTAGLPEGWTSFGAYLEFLQKTGISCNLAWFAGHNTLRRTVGLVGPEASEEQLQGMERGLREAMDAGALGLSTGLEFEPGRTAKTAEVLRLAKVAGEYGGYYASHIRNRDSRLQEAIDEFLAIVRGSGTIGEISHLNVRHNSGAAPDAWERAVAAMEKSRSDGYNVLADCTPYRYGTGQLAAILPPWLRAEGPARAAEMMREPAVRARLRGDCDRYWRFIHRGEWQRVFMVKNNVFPEFSGKSLAEIAELQGKDPWESCFDILAAYGEKMDSLGVVGLLFTEEHVAAMVAHPLFNLGVDGFSSSLDPSFGIPCAHPIHFAGMVHYLTYHVREKHTLRLEEAIRKMTSMPATHFGLRGRGLLRQGAFADVVVFDPQALEDASTLEHPLAYARGVEHVLVNGVPVIEGGEHTGARPGRNLLRG